MKGVFTAMKNNKSMDELYKRIFDFDFLIKNGYFDVIRSNKEIIDAGSVNQSNPKVDTIATDIFNMDDVINNVPKSELMKILDNDIGKINKGKSLRWSEPIYFSTYKTDISRREYKMPNLYNYAVFVDWICNNANFFINILKKDENSTSRFFNEFNYKYRVTNQLKNRILRSGNHILKTDLSNFYPSLYTHTISWIINGKDVAKKNLQLKKITKADIIDKLITSCQYGETHGLPTGSLLTRIIAEIYMCYFDKKLLGAFKEEISFVRYVDDIQFPYTTDNYKNRFLRVFRKLCREYELQVNENKTGTESFPYSYTNNKATIFSFFDNYKYMSSIEITRNINGFIAELRNKIYQFLDFCVQQESRGNKGAVKSIFSVVTNTIKDLKKENIINDEGVNSIFIKSSDLSGTNLFLKLLELSLKDARLSNYFIRFTKDIINLGVSSKELVRLTTSYFHELKENTRLRIKFYIENDYDQELYQLLLYAVFFNVNNLLTKKEIMNLINLDRDDFTLCLCIILYLKNDWEFSGLIRKVHVLFVKIHELYSNDDSLMLEKGWLVKYFVFDLIKSGIIPEKIINKMYKKQGYKNGGKEIYLNYRYVLKKSNNINKFYSLLLKYNVHLVSFGNNFNYIE